MPANLVDNSVKYSFACEVHPASPEAEKKIIVSLIAELNSLFNMKLGRGPFLDRLGDLVKPAMKKSPCNWWQQRYKRRRGTGGAQL
jgi:hypothetical protein